MTAIGNIVPITMISRLVGFRNSNLDQLWTSAVNGTRMVGSTLPLDDLIASASGMEGDSCLDRRPIIGGVGGAE